MDNKAPDAFRTISEVAEELELPQHVLRFWETRFREIKPMKRGGGRRYYRPDDVELLRGIRHLLYGEGYTIRGVQRILRSQGIKFVQSVWEEGAEQPPHGITAEEDDVLTATEGVDEQLAKPGGLGGRLASLIGRDLGERHADAPRPDPPFTGAPVPHIDPEERILHSEAEQVRVERIENPAGALRAPQLGSEQVDKLQAALHELAECRKLIAAASGREA